MGISVKFAVAPNAIPATRPEDDIVLSFGRRISARSACRLRLRHVLMKSA
jgi:hypothetical protein